MESSHTLCKAHIRARRPAQHQSGPLPLSFWRDLSEYRLVCAAKAWRRTVEHSTNGQATNSNTAPVCSARRPGNIHPRPGSQRPQFSGTLQGPKTHFHEPLLGLTTLSARSQVELLEYSIVAFTRCCCDSVLVISPGSASMVLRPALRFISAEDHFRCQMLDGTTTLNLFFCTFSSSYV